VTPDGAFLDQGRLTLRFKSTLDQLKARDLIAEARPNQFTIALSKASRCRSDAQSGFESHQIGLGPSRRRVPRYQVDVQGAVKQLLDHHEQDFRASLRNAAWCIKTCWWITHESRAVLFRDADSFAKGKAAILADSRNLSLTDATVDGAPALELHLTPQEIKERQDYRFSKTS